MSQFIEVIDSLDRSPDTIVSRFPEQGTADIKLGAQLVVRESQAAVFFRDGRALDTFGPGRHTLSTLNIPVLTKLLSLPTGFQSPFQAEVMFCNLKTFPNQKWGTAEPILFRDSELDMVRLRSFGVFSFRVSNPQVFVNTLVGTVGEFTTDAVSGFFKNVIVSHVADFLGEHLRTLLDLPQLYSELSAGIEAHVIQDFAKYGVSISDFKIMSISPPDYVQEAIDKRSAMAAVGNMDDFMRYQAARAIEQAASGDGSGGGDGGSGGLAGAGIGLGAGLGMGAGMAGLVSQAFQPRAAPCAGCQAPLAAGARFCAGCGRAASAPSESCGACKASLPAGASFCPSCGAGQEHEPCGACGAENPATARYCANCGTALGSE
jgi:membrane protease subunit (stomatin/prohibitin family)